MTTVTDHEHPHRSGSRRRILLLSTLTTLLLAAGLLFATAAPAAAHDEIVSSSPEAGSTVSVVPEEISLTFSGEVGETIGTHAIDPHDRDIPSPVVTHHMLLDLFVR